MSNLVDSDLPLIPAIVGPTAVGKTSLALELVDSLNAEMVSCDSRQIYKFMTIGTAKPTSEELQGNPCHLIDFIEPDEVFSAAKYRLAAENVIDRLLVNGKTPLIVGGTGLYLKALISGLFETPQADQSYRRELNRQSSEQLHRQLQHIDPQSAAEIPSGNKARIIRALEIYQTTGKKKSDLVKTGKYPRRKFHFMIFGLNCYREKLYQIINQRVDKMIGEGFVAEVEKLVEMGYHDSPVLENTVGYKEILRYLDGSYKLERCIELIKQKTRNYAKRQVTWFKKVPGLIAIDTLDPKRSDLILNHLSKFKLDR